MAPKGGHLPMQANPSQRAVLALVLDEHPDQLTTADLEREVGSSEQAIHDLAIVGLLRRQGDSILPTRAALHFERLEAL